MNHRVLGRTAVRVSEIGYGMYGMSGPEWSGTDRDETRRALQLALDLGCTFFDTAWGYGAGAGERLLGELVRANPNRTIVTATKVPPKNMQWPSRRGVAIADVFPPDHIREYTERSLANLGLDRIGLLQFHVWEDDWSEDRHWQRCVDDLRREGVIDSVGISLNRWEPWNGVKTVATGLIDSVQVIYNIFDQSPEDELFPMCRKMSVAVVARVPFDEGGLSGTLTADTRWPVGDWRNIYFGAENLQPTVDRAEAVRNLLPPGMTLTDLALAFVLANPDVSTVIPGMRTRSHVTMNLAVSDAPRIDPALLARLRKHRWDRQPTSWSL